MKKYILFSVAALLALLFSCQKPDGPADDPNNPPAGFDINNLQPGLSSDPQLPSADESCTLYFKAGGKYPFSGYDGELYAHIGVVNFEWEHVQADWDVNIEKCLWQKTEVADVWKLPIEPTIRQWFGVDDDEPLTRIGVVVRNADGTEQTKPDFFLSVKDEGREFKPADVEMEAMPSGAQHGINITGQEVTLVLYEKDKDGKHYPHCFLVGDFNDWKVSNRFQMKRDENAGCWWYKLSGIDASKEYRFQYHLIDSEGDALRISDPYSEIVYSGEDKWISSSTYPDMPAYPSGTSGLVSAFQINRPEYNWKIKDYNVADKNDIVIYELHLRDFSATHDLSGAEEKLDYLENLGINAIELMPVQEFDGNNSWGYDPCSYFALDKTYGTREHYKAFVDECHSRGIAVILDVVYNHATGSHPMAKLYWNSEKNQTAANNPWFNEVAPHPYSVFHDWNHENPMVREHIKRSLRYLLEEYKFDGFRFDLTKGFTQRKCTDATVGNYDQGRIDVLSEYAKAIFDLKPGAVVILEHFCETREEKALAAAGMQMWRNVNNAYCQTAMGWLKDGDDLNQIWTGSTMPFGSWVGFMESHDEERTAYKSLKWGNGITGNLAARMQRLRLNAAFSLLVPGPKMIWQFGELGYDVSIEENGRTGEKPLHWDYYDIPKRRALYGTYAKLLKFRRDNARLFDMDASFEMYAGSGVPARTIFGSNEGKSFTVIGNFQTVDSDFSYNLKSGGFWYDLFSGESYDAGYDGNVHIPLKAGEFVVLTNFK